MRQAEGETGVQRQAKSHGSLYRPTVLLDEVLIRRTVVVGLDLVAVVVGYRQSGETDRIPAIRSENNILLSD